MAADWYYEENGGAVGPVTIEEIADRIDRANDRPHLVWTAAMAEWTDARDLPQFIAALENKGSRRMGAGQAPAGRRSLRERARHELISYLTISSYLLVWFSAVLFYKATILNSVGFSSFGFALVKALILGKFFLVLEALKIGERSSGGGILAVEIVKKALLFTLLLTALSVGEELIVGYFHGKDTREILSEIAGGSILQLIATDVLMFLVLLPYFAFRRLAQSVGELPELLFTRPTERNAR